MPRRLPAWSTVAPLVAAVLLAVTWSAAPDPARAPGLVLVLVVASAIVGAVLSAVEHAEVVASRVGEPFGSLVLAVAVTVIEVGLIVMLSVGDAEGAASLARDTVFAAVMISLNGIVGLSLVVGSVRGGLARFNPEGTGAALATVATLAGLTLVLPRYTTSEPGPEFSGSQLAFAGVASLLLWGLFVFTQTIRNRSFFLPVEERRGGTEDGGHGGATTATAYRSLGLLVVSLVGVVGLAKVASPAIESGVTALGFPYAVVGVAIALVVLLPETLAAVRAAARRRTQTALNLAFGSAMASIGLTIPTIAVASIWLDGPLELGLGPVQTVLLLLTVLVATLNVAPGRASPLQGGLHLVLLSAFLFLTVVP